MLLKIKHSMKFCIFITEIIRTLFRLESTRTQIQMVILYRKSGLNEFLFRIKKQIWYRKGIKYSYNSKLRYLFIDFAAPNQMQ